MIPLGYLLIMCLIASSLYSLNPKSSNIFLVDCLYSLLRPNGATAGRRLNVRQRFRSVEENAPKHNKGKSNREEFNDPGILLECNLDKDAGLVPSLRMNTYLICVWSFHQFSFS